MAASPSHQIVAVVSLAYSDARRILRAMTMLVIFARCSLGSQSKLQRIFFRGMCGVVRWALVALSILRGSVV